MAELMLVNNPKKRRKTTAKRRPTRRRRTYSRNPSFRSAFNLKSIMATAKSGAVGAGGAIAVDFAMSKLPLPAMLQTSAMMPAVRGLVGVMLGALIGGFMKNRKLGEEIATGAVAVSVYGVAKTMMPGVAEVSGGDLLGFEDGLLGLGYFNPATVQRAPSYGGFQTAPVYGSDDSNMDGLGYQSSPDYF